MKQWKNNPNILVVVWKDKSGWCAKIEQHGSKPKQWYASGFQTKEAAQAILDEQLKAIENEG